VIEDIDDGLPTRTMFSGSTLANALVFVFRDVCVDDIRQVVDYCRYFSSGMRQSYERMHPSMCTIGIFSCAAASALWWCSCHQEDRRGRLKVAQYGVKARNYRRHHRGVVVAAAL